MLGVMPHEAPSLPREWSATPRWKLTSLEWTYLPQSFRVSRTSPPNYVFDSNNRRFIVSRSINAIRAGVPGINVWAFLDWCAISDRGRRKDIGFREAGAFHLMLIIKST